MTYRLLRSACVAGLLGVSGVIPGCAPLEGRSRGQEPRPPAAETDAEAGSLLRALLEAHNRERAAEKLPPLALNPKLEAAAAKHARDMAEHDKMSHEGSDGSTPTQRVEREGYHFRATGENVAEGQETVDEVMKGWMKSPPHRRNILGAFTEMGGARAIAKDGTPYWCVDFGIPWPNLDPAKAEEDLVRAINAERTAAKRPPLMPNDTLRAAAERHARDVAAADKFLPKDSDGLTPFGRIEREGGRFEQLAKELATGVPTPDEVVKTWVDRPSQRKNLLGDFTDIGVGYATTEKGVPYWCVLLGRAAQ